MGIELGSSKTPVGMRIYAIGDVHGCLAELREMMALISQDLIRRPVRKYRIIFTGDYMDRGPRSKGVVSFLISLCARNKKVICLRGNHDDFLINFMADPIKHGPIFFRNGAVETLRSFGVRVDENDRSDEHLEEIRRYCRLIVNPTHLNFLSRLSYSKSYGDYFFCHAGIRPGVSIRKQSKRDLMWIREEFLSHSGLFEKVIVHGHTPQTRVDIQPNRVNIDTKCYATGTLTCLVLQDDSYRILQTGA